ncbi:hypothetical protein NDU88_009425 [Pleurodeles waltl]|uniref:Uncharacterized protein n=1 Tax=Pleurodeles waltl TaxID=8319 RepID=A0AAV7QRL4_PLEWA|nr:hypothetical protein NDU88_009425 [Pleurodeles waltl]
MFDNFSVARLSHCVTSGPRKNDQTFTARHSGAARCRLIHGPAPVRGPGVGEHCFNVAHVGAQEEQLELGEIENQTGKSHRKVAREEQTKDNPSELRNSPAEDLGLQETNNDAKVVDARAE